MAFAPHLCAQTGASRAFRACVGQADAQGASCQAATRPLSLESLWSEQKELKVKGLESLWSEKKELKVKCGWPAAGLRQSNICGWPAAGLRQSNMLEKLHKTQSPRRFQHTLYCTRTHTRIQHRRNKQQHTRTGLSVGLVHAHTRRNRSRNTRRNRERREQGCQQFDPVRSSSIQFDPPAPCL